MESIFESVEEQLVILKDVAGNVYWPSFSLNTIGEYQIDNGYCEEMEMPDCSEMTLSQCNNDSTCEWIQNISYGNCGSLTVSQCYDYPGECYVDSNPGWYDNSGSYCTGGTYQIDNSYCQEIEVLECSDMNQLQCGVDSTCEWVEDVQTGWCGSHNTAASCPDYPVCSWGCDGCYYLGECCGSIICNGGYYQINNSYCEEVSFIAGDSNGDGLLNFIGIPNYYSSLTSMPRPEILAHAVRAVWATSRAMGTMPRSSLKATRVGASKAFRAVTYEPKEV